MGLGAQGLWVKGLGVKGSGVRVKGLGFRIPEDKSHGNERVPWWQFHSHL